MQQRGAFTLIEVLIAIALMGIILPVLYSSVDVLNDANRHLYEHLVKSKLQARAMRTLYLDIAGSDGNLSIRKNDFDRFCIAHTTNTLYGLGKPKVCWVVLKDRRTLVRIEGTNFRLPLREGMYAEADVVQKDLVVFRINWTKDKVLVTLQEKGKEPLAFLVQGVTKLKPPRKKRTVKKQKRRTALPLKNTPTGAPKRPL